MEHWLQFIAHWFSVDNTMLELWGYKLSYLEFVGTLLNLWSVVLVTRNNIWTWPIGNLAVLLFGILFYQIQLYSDLLEQGYFFVTGFYGWILWLYAANQPAGNDQDSSGKKLPIRQNDTRANLIYLLVIIGGTALLTWLAAHASVFWPRLFPEPAAYPLLDAFTTVLSFAATILMAHRRIECWYLWLLVDCIDVGLYLARGTLFLSILYAIFLILAARGLLNWRGMARRAAHA